MFKLITVCVLFSALAGAEPPFYPFQQQRADLEPYAAAGPPSGPLLLLPGEYIVPVNSPYQQYGVPVNEAQVNAPQQEYQPAFVATSQFATNQQPFGQLQVAPGVQQPVFTARFTAGAPQPNEKDAEQFNPQTFNQQRNQQKFTNEADAENDEEQVQGQQPKRFRGTVKFSSPNQEDDSSAESVERYQQQDKYKQQRGNNRYTASQQSGRYTQQQQQQQQQFNQQQTSNNQYYQPNQQQSNYYQPANDQNQYSRVNKYTPPRKYIPVSRATTTEASTTTEFDDSTTTEVATTSDENGNDLKGVKSNYEEGDDVEQVNEAQGSYYLLLPNGKLQKIVYMTADDLKKMQYVARIQYETIEPISGPVYAYNPKSAPFVQVF